MKCARVLLIFVLFPVFLSFLLSPEYNLFFSAIWPIRWLILVNPADPQNPAVPRTPADPQHQDVPQHPADPLFRLTCSSRPICRPWLFRSSRLIRSSRLVHSSRLDRSSRLIRSTRLFRSTWLPCTVLYCIWTIQAVPWPSIPDILPHSRFTLRLSFDCVLYIILFTEFYWYLMISLSYCTI